jgi:hypothetical protein
MCLLTHELDLQVDLPQRGENLMKHLKTMGLAAVMALVLVACFGATSASATTICVTGTITAPCSDGTLGGTVGLTSTNSQLTVDGSGSGTIQCSSSTLHGVAPAFAAPVLQIPATLGYSGCTAFGFIAATVTVGSGCHPITLDVTFHTLTDATAAVTVPTGCTFDVRIPSINCTVTIHGPFTLGTTVTNGSATRKTHATITSGDIPNVTVHPGGGFGCPAAGSHTGTLTGTYAVSTPATAPGITVIN